MQHPGYRTVRQQSVYVDNTVHCVVYIPIVAWSLYCLHTHCCMVTVLSTYPLLHGHCIVYIPPYAACFGWPKDTDNLISQIAYELSPVNSPVSSPCRFCIIPYKYLLVIYVHFVTAVLPRYLFTKTLISHITIQTS